MSFSVANLITALFPELNATGFADLVFWDSDALYQWAAEATRKMATIGCFADRDTSITLQPGTAVYDNPPNHVALMRLAAAGALLRPSSAGELAALSDFWEADSNTPTRWIGDWMGHDLSRVYPTPIAAAPLEIVMARFPDDVTAGSPTIQAPTVFGDYLSTRMLAEARRQEGDGAMPDVADALDREAALYEQIFTAYWGTP